MANERLTPEQLRRLGDNLQNREDLRERFPTQVVHRDEIHSMLLAVRELQDRRSDDLTEAQATIQVRALHPSAVAEERPNGWSIRVEGPNGCGYLGRAVSPAEAWIEAAHLLKIF